MQRTGLHLGAAAAEGSQASNLGCMQLAGAQHQAAAPASLSCRDLAGACCLWLPAACSCHATSLSVPGALGMLTRRMMHRHSLGLLMRLAAVGEGLALSVTSFLPHACKVKLSTTSSTLTQPGMLTRPVTYRGTCRV